MAKTQRKLKAANHGKRPASAQARKSKRRGIKT
ncbi:50S ribosomal protein bL37 [Calycomorphotria hydatis]